MTEHMNEEMLNAMASVQEVKVGDLVQGEVLTIDDNKQAIVGIIGAGVEGVIPLKELSTITVQNVTDVVNIGDIIDLVVISEIGKDKENGSYLLSKRRVDAKKVWEDIEKAFAAGETIEAPVTAAKVTSLASAAPPVVALPAIVTGPAIRADVGISDRYW